MTDSLEDVLKGPRAERAGASAVGAFLADRKLEDLAQQVALSLAVAHETLHGQVRGGTALVLALQLPRESLPAIRGFPA